MKKLLTLIAALLAMSATANQTLDYSKLAQHPRLMLKEGDIKAIRQKIEHDQPLLTLHDIIKRRTNDFIPAEPTKYRMVGKRLLGRCRAVLERVCYCSYMYLISGDEIYARRAEKEMLAAADFASWNPSHFLDVAEMTTALAIGYDWLYDWLSPASRKIIEDAIIEKGLRAANPKMWWYHRANNWNQVCNCGMVMGALAVFERIPDEAKIHIERSLKSNPQAQECYGPDGVYPEGFGYWEYGTWFEVMLIESLRTALGTSFDLEKAPGFLESAKFMNFMQTPTGYTYNFSDCGNPLNMVNPLLYWFAHETNDMSLVWQDRQRLLGEEFIRGVNRQTPLAMLFASRCDLKEIEPIADNFWYGQGNQPLFIYRSDFSNSEGAYLAAKGGTASNNHAHMDAGSFIYEWGGVCWASDLGSQNYHSLESKGLGIWKSGQDSDRWRVFRLGNFSHNTLTVNEKLHNVKGMATMDKLYNTKSRHGAEFDLTPIFFDLSSAYRTIYIDKSDKVTCIDKLKARDIECQVRWNMTTTATARIVDDRTISLTKNGKEVILRADAPKGVKAYIMSNAPTTEYDCENKGTCRVGFATTVQPNSKAVIKVVLEPQK